MLRKWDRARRRASGLLLWAALLLASGCANMQNYLGEGPHFAGTAPITPPTGERLTVVTFNIQFGHEIDLALQELQADRRLAGADVYLLQELDEGDAARAAAALGCHHVYYPMSVHEEHGANFGNAVLARGEIVSHRKVVFPHEAWKNGQRRGATVAIVNVRGREIEVASAHTETAWMSLSRRLDQVSALCRETGWAGRPTIIGGDFNVPFRGESRALRERFERYQFELASDGVRDTARLYFGLQATIDFVFVRGFEPFAAGKNETAASDHRPVWAEFAWPE